MSVRSAKHPALEEVTESKLMQDIYEVICETVLDQISRHGVAGFLHTDPQHAEETREDKYVKTV
jgi:hypothetical protein